MAEIEIAKGKKVTIWLPSCSVTMVTPLCAQMLKQIKQQLTHERTMKQDAFHQVDELLAQMNNLDTIKANTKIAIATKGNLPTDHLMCCSL